ncbi:MAG: histidine kinase dimerization/phospho-acceptor domain-containing protein [Nitrosarchaeum sp.]
MIDTLEPSMVSTKKIMELINITDEISKATLEKLHHILRTPITPILVYTEMLLENKFGLLNEEQTKKIQIIYENTNYLLDIINSMDNVLTSTKNQSVKYHQ